MRPKQVIPYIQTALRDLARIGVIKQSSQVWVDRAVGDLSELLEKLQEAEKDHREWEKQVEQQFKKRYRRIR